MQSIRNRSFIAFSGCNGRYRRTEGLSDYKVIDIDGDNKCIFKRGLPVLNSSSSNSVVLSGVSIVHIKKVELKFLE
jgi:hypothetical protein